jgi:hypothetical protein
MYWIKLIKEIRIWWLARKVALANQSELEEFGVRVDWVGRLYTVINLPEEVASQPYSEQPYVLSQLRKYDEILLRLQLSDVLYPEFEKIPGESAYLLVLTPEMEYLDWLRFILNTLGWIAGYYGVVALHNIIEKKFAINIVQEIISLF